jgi:hypothetical protein
MTKRIKRIFKPLVLEAELQDAIVDAGHKLGYRVAHFRGVRVQRKDGTVYYQTPCQYDAEGWPDLFLLHEEKKRSIWIECKSDTGKCSPEQIAWHDALARAGEEVYLVFPKHLDEIIQILMLKEKPSVNQRKLLDSAIIYEVGENARS